MGPDQARSARWGFSQRERADRWLILAAGAVFEGAKGGQWPYPPGKRAKYGLFSDISFFKPFLMFCSQEEHTKRSP